MRRVLLTSALVLTAALSACGDGPTAIPSVGQPSLDPSGEPTVFPVVGGSIDMPASWTITRGVPGEQMMAKATSGEGAIVVWRYPRTEPFPSTQKDLRNTRKSLRAAVLARDPDFKVTAAILRRLPEPAVEIAGIGTIAGTKRSIRSLHVYGGDQVETVVDCIGPVADAAQFNETICAPVIRSLELP